ncbi:tetratricopeptide repeat protein [Planktothrix agardhii 1806]|jgi:tetratricopeptide (TPR) repeat protein|uniref:tetratricopeptide repeat protein n=1 Tax=Planktothrix agardhii TaxID=1160 RepID=UPI001F199707|nr:tetratricopeptide repeat protein [Planktothrix agardhii]MCF3569112.1 tetratricopeptide repeat protein [Planktothrix agardhii 1807]MCF3569294.1 tetratricopeptide repeat protein [Planktothrix agardhii 1805]MCF3584098.1 tetratricopeptide repeat protein [Planktothrix agardhii 1803]MCF3604555.1 tetratricopeptide repeat protein [Planktothrix agardhii 1804]MCF3614639.1 tetratricopeptide repeat protein [Planktothrix agardhii 1806]
MDIDSALDFISSQLMAKKLKTLSTLETIILKEAWRGKDRKSYDEIGNSEGFAGESVKTAAYKLWRRLSDLCAEKVNRDNVQAVVERYYNKVVIASPSKPIPSAPNSIESNSAIAIPENIVNENINFIGRENAIAHLKTKINQGAKIILIQAAAGIGKTTLATEFLKNQNFDKILYLTMAKERETISPVETIVEEWLRKDFEEEPGRDFMVSLGRLKRLLQNQKIGILIDNLEPALDSEFRFIEPHRRYIELLRMLTDPMVQSVTLITSRERLCEGDITVETYRLPELDYCAWKQYFEYYQINNYESILTEMHKAYGGNAKAMRILCGAVEEDYKGDIQTYWNCNKAEILAKRDLKDLVNSQFKRLQELDINAFKLLCRLGCYRYQDVPTVPYNGLLGLLWDVPEGEQRRVIESLKNRSLVEVNKGEFFLHPMVREEAIARLRKSEDWETANIKAAEFWTESVKSVETIKDGLTALEAYYHYVEIKDWNNAGIVFIKEINNKNNTLNQTEPLGRELYRLGVGHRIIILLNQIIESITWDYVLSENYMILGDGYSQLGEISKAINSYLMLEKILIQQNESFSESKDDFKIKRIKLNAAYTLFNLGFCYIKLGETEKALDYLGKFALIYQENYKYLFYDEYDIADLLSMMAFLHSLKGDQKQSLNYAEAAYKQLQTAKLDIWGIGSSFLFLASAYKNLKFIKQSLNLYKQALKFAKTNDYFIAQAIGLTGLGELYRMQGDFATALTHHQESIEILEYIGAKCDLAEAYYQLALTYQQMGDRENSKPNFDKAIKLFEEIEAPRRVERVIKSII